MRFIFWTDLAFDVFLCILGKPVDSNEKVFVSIFSDLLKLVIRRKVERHPLSINTQQISFFDKSLAAKCHQIWEFC